MSDAAAVDLGLASGTPAPQPTGPDQARAFLEARKADPDWVKKHIAGDHEARAEFERLTQMMHALPAGTTITGGPSIEQQRNQQADWLADQGEDPAIVEQVRKGTPELADVYMQAVGMKRSLLSDPAWRARYNAGGHAEQQQLRRLNVIISNPIKLENK